ncbi:hypothetical protein ACIU1J_07810 [Azospirillum doebereinerae]|uniref:hypothetical protein n=1 Tax=Azospirillum doebereinerae TaxID=92933 RepID=UPI00384BA43E
MSASRAEPPSHAAGRAVALALTLAALGWTLPAGAQGVGAPIRLFPPGAGSPAMAPPAVATPSLPVPSPAPAAAPSVEPPKVVPEAAAPVAANPPAVAPPSMAVVPTVPPPAVIRGEALGPPDPDGAGLLDGVQGLGGDPWRGIGRAELLPLIAALPVNAPSPAAKALARRLLLSAGSPAVQADEPPPARRFGALRIEKLARLGDPRGAADLAARLPGVLAADEAAARALTDSELLAGSIDCGKAQERGRGFDDLYWRKLELFCRVRTGDRAGAELTLALLREKAPPHRPLPSRRRGADRRRPRRRRGTSGTARR